MPGPDSEAVRAHYDRLAARYDDGANRACNAAYRALVRQVLRPCTQVLELGAGSGSLLAAVPVLQRVAADLSLPMLTARPPAPAVVRVNADATRLPFIRGAFDGVYSVNMLEHVPDPAAVVAEAARVLRPGGLLLLITPNGGARWLLELLEKLHLKLPEGPHRFLTARDLRELASPFFAVRAVRRFLALPAGPPGWVRTVDRAAMGQGLFLYGVFTRRE